VGAVLIEGGRVLLIRRGKEPLKGRWSLPGGTVEAGETLQAALTREMLEETALTVRVGELITAFDRIERRADALLHHYVILDFLCRREAGEARAGSDAEAVAWATPEELPGYGLHEKALEVIQAGFRLSRR
jgi:ADP-ribose pyrophosphatase YjhB (NUDIX family)